MNGKFDVYLLWPFGKKLISILYTHFNTRDSTVSDKSISKRKSSICDQIGKIQKIYINEPFSDTVNPILASKVHKLLRTSQLISADLRTWIQTFLSSRTHRLLFDISERPAKNANSLLANFKECSNQLLLNGRYV